MLPARFCEPRPNLSNVVARYIILTVMDHQTHAITQEGYSCQFTHASAICQNNKKLPRNQPNYRLLAGFGAALKKPAAGNLLIGQDERTGEKYLKLPMPKPEVLETALKALGELLKIFPGRA